MAIRVLLVLKNFHGDEFEGTGAMRGSLTVKILRIYRKVEVDKKPG